MVKTIFKFELVLVLVLCNSVELSLQNVVTCSGKIKSDAKIDYSKINIELLSKSGSLVEKTDCAPNNGYFVVPVYDKGDYVMQVAPPAGWGFDPMEVPISIDYETDTCTLQKDIIFKFTGFSITGQVTSFSRTVGPRGVNIGIKGLEMFKEIQTTENGIFQLSNILPGEYLLSGSHSTWKISQDPVPVSIKDDSVELPINSITVEGYDVKGVIKSDGEPVANVYFLLYGSSDQKFSCGSDKVNSSGLDSLRGNPTPSCVALSSEEGIFIFQSLPPGKYRIVPYYRSVSNSMYQVSPNEVLFSVENDSVVVEPEFEVQGFTVFGKILQKPNGEGLSGAVITVDGDVMATTDKEGRYQINNVTAGPYIIEVSVPNVEFDTLRLTLNPSTPQIADIYPARYSVNGMVKIIVHPAKEKFKASSCSIEVIADDTDESSISSPPTANIASVSDEGLFQLMLAPGKYTIKVITQEEDSSRGLFFRNQSLPLTVWYASIDKSQLVFRQFTRKLTVEIKCLGINKDLVVNVASVADSFKTKKSTGCFSHNPTSVEIERLLPGSYKVSLGSEKNEIATACWNQDQRQVTVSSGVDEPSPVILFTQTGYKMRIKSSHETDVLVTEGSKSFSETFKLQKGQNNICLEQSGDYSIVPRSCYTFDADMYMFMTSMILPITMKATGHKVTVVVNAPKNSDVKVNVGFSNTKKPRKDQLLEPSKGARGEDTTMEQVHKYTFNAKAGTVVNVHPVVADLICNPTEQSHHVGNVCPEFIPPFNCSRGIFIDGIIDPPIKGVAIKVTSDSTVLNALTDENGKYQVGPLSEGVDVRVEPALDQYVFTPVTGDETQYNFMAVRVSKIIIKIVDTKNDTLDGALISIRGEEYQSTNVCDEDCTVVYSELYPGDYYLKPILREYEFSPSSLVTALTQGEDLEITFTGKRVAFSVSGKVMSLNRTPLREANVQIISEGDTCNSFKESASSDEGGHFTFRSIMPSCSYYLSVITINEDSSSIIETAIPRHRLIKIVDDAVGQDFISVLKPSELVITGNVITPTPEHLPTLKVVVYSDKFLDTVLYTAVPDSMGFFTISLTPDSISDFFVHPESSLSAHYYSIEANVTAFSSSDDHITVYFSAQPSNKVADSSSRGSFLGILLVVGAIFVLFNLDKIVNRIQPSLIPTVIKRLPFLKKHKRR